MSVTDAVGRSRIRTVRDLRLDARARAAEMLDDVWPEGTYPVDPVQMARRIGVEVFSAQLGNDVFGMLVGSASGSIIYLDSDQPERRYRFTAAHELGHYVDRANELNAAGSFIDRRSDKDRGTPAEIYANEFAGSLLMPLEPLRRYVSDGLDDIELSEIFGVSLDALGYRRRLLDV